MNLDSLMKIGEAAIYEDNTMKGNNAGISVSPERASPFFIPHPISFGKIIKHSKDKTITIILGT